MVSVPRTGFSKRAGVTNRDSIGPETDKAPLSTRERRASTVNTKQELKKYAFF
jgi:hypothetical protein